MIFNIRFEKQKVKLKLRNFETKTLQLQCKTLTCSISKKKIKWNTKCTQIILWINKYSKIETVKSF